MKERSYDLINVWKKNLWFFRIFTWNIFSFEQKLTKIFTTRIVSFLFFDHAVWKSWRCSAIHYVTDQSLLSFGMRCDSMHQINMRNNGNHSRSNNKCQNHFLWILVQKWKSSNEIRFFKRILLSPTNPMKVLFMCRNYTHLASYPCVAFSETL